MPNRNIQFCDDSNSTESCTETSTLTSEDISNVEGTGHRAEHDLPALSDVIEGMGYGPGHLIQLLWGGGVYIADGAEMMLIGSVTRAVAREWDLDATSRGLVVTFVFVGVLVGNLIGGWTGDRYGRRLPILCSYLFVAVFSILSAQTNGFFSLSAIRFCVGVAFGVGVPAWNTLSTEIVPTKWRDFQNGVSMMLFSAGEGYAAMLIYMSDPMMKHLDWRWLLMMGAVPSVVLTIGTAIFLVDSPYWLALRSKEKAQDMLRSLSRMNCQSGAELDFRAEQPDSQDQNQTSFADQLRTLCNREFGGITAVLCFSCFVLNFVYYGGLYAFPQVFADMEGSSTSPAINLAWGALWEVPGLVIGITASMCIARKPMMLLYLFILGASLVAFAWSASIDDRTGPTDMLLHSAYIGIKLFIVADFLVFYVYAAEVYPTVVRATGSAACIASGRIGSITCPIAFEHLQALTGDFQAFFYLMAVFCVVNAIMVAVLPETWGAKLAEDAESDSAAGKGIAKAAGSTSGHRALLKAGAAGV